MTEKAIEAAAKTIPAIIEKLRGLNGPDREVDAEIATAAAGYAYEKRGNDRKAWFYAPDGRRYQLYSYDSECLPRFTGSLDAVTALIERDGYQWLREHQDSMTAYKPWGRRFSAAGANNSIALLIAYFGLKEIGE